jgi:serine protease Do
MSKMKKNLFFSGLIALIVSVSSIGVYSWFYNTKKTVKIEHINNVPSNAALYTVDENGNAIPLDFNETAEKVLDAVVHIKSTHVYGGNSQGFEYRNIPDPFRDFFGDEFEQFFEPRFRFETPKSNPRSKDNPSRVGTGSGVIISQDGYIVTNNHVIAEADDIEVTLHDNRTYKATVIGTDPSTDLALLQVKEKNLPTVSFVNSNEVRIGQWVLAVGNPMGLNSTVTAGIVSAKGRNINILKDKYAIENFIQTDAAINPGNSGGALVNLQGGLVGINTAIASPTGMFAGYGFAIPSNIVNKVVEDLLEYGVVQRGVLGVMIRTLDGNLAKEKDLDLTQGVYVDSLMENSAAAKSGVKVGDIILAVDGVQIKTSPELQGIIGSRRPGEEVTLKINRKGKETEIKVTLNNTEGSTELTNKDTRQILKVLGAELEDVDKDMAKKLDISGGVKVKKLYAGKLRKYTQMRDGFIITAIDGKPIKSVDEFVETIEKKKGGVMLEGIYEDLPGAFYYAFGL